MIKRIVLLNFKEDKRDAFLAIFKSHSENIKKFPQCKQLDLLEDKKDISLFFTFSTWTSEEALENYRSSEYFRDIWGKIKPWFSEKPKAWTVEQKEFNS